MYFSRWLAVATVALAACQTAAQTAAPTADSAPTAAGGDDPCRANPAGCTQAEEGNRMRQAMRDICKKTPEVCRARREKVMQRREPTGAVIPVGQK